MDSLGTRAALAGVAAMGACGLMAWAVRGRSSAVFGPSVWRGDRDRKAVALTFDDGPSESTPALLEILERHGARATFFQCGANVDRLPDVARAVVQAGHEIGNHSYSHPYFHFKTQAFMEAELRRTQDAIARAAGVTPKLMRAPFGVRWPGLGAAQRALGLTGVMWSVIGYDWKCGAGRVAEHVARKMENGAIVCLHDGRELDAKPDAGNTIEAVRRLVPILLSRGYRLETVSQLLCRNN